MMRKIFILLAFSIIFLVSCKREVVCTMEAKICPDGSAVGRIAPNCEFAECPEIKHDSKKLIGDNGEHFCSEADKAKEVCPQAENQVCGWFNEKIQCFAYPCAQTYQNSCFACANENVAHWTDGVCPKAGS